MALAGPDAAPAKADVASSVKRLIRQLDDDELAKREAAEKELIALGTAALKHLPLPTAKLSAGAKVSLERVRRVQDTLGRLDTGATLATLPDPLLGQRLVGNAVDRYAVKAALNAAGANPIVAEAFHDRSEGHAQPRLRNAAGR